LFLKTGKLKFVPIKPYAELRCALKKFSKEETCLISEHIYSVVRTHFDQNGGDLLSPSATIEANQ